MCYVRKIRLRPNRLSERIYQVRPKFWLRSVLDFINIHKHSTWKDQQFYITELPIKPNCSNWLRLQTRAALQIQDRSPKSRPVASLNQSQTQFTRPVATGLGLQRDPVLCSCLLSQTELLSNPQHKTACRHLKNTTGWAKKPDCL